MKMTQMRRCAAWLAACGLALALPAGQAVAQQETGDGGRATPVGAGLQTAPAEERLGPPVGAGLQTAPAEERLGPSVGAGLPSPVAAPPEITIERPGNNALTSLGHLTISGRAPDGAELTLSIGGQVVGSGVAGQQAPGAYEFVNVPVGAGPQEILLQGRTPDGREITARQAIHVQGPPAALTIEGPERVAADPNTVTPYTIRVSDRWGRPAADGAFITLSGEGAILQTPDENPNAAGVQVRPHNGAAVVAVRSPHKAGAGQVRALWGELVAAHAIRFFTPARPLFVNGQFTGAFGSVSPGLVGTGGSPFLGSLRDMQVSLFTRGSVGDGYLFTGAFDSRRSLQEDLFKQLDPDRNYPTFGDSSSVFYEAQSRDRLYVQVEKDDNVYRYGDMNTGIALNSLGAYQRTLTGMRLQHRTPVGPVVLFGARTAQAVMRSEVRANGTSGYYFLSNPPIVVGSERVAIEVRDRNRPQIVLRTETRTRLIDYDVDYEQGTLFFRQPVPGIDSLQNPVYIVAVYESRAAGARSTVSGIRADTRSGSFTFGSSLIHEDRGDASYSLRSLEGSVKLPGNTLLSAEHASTRSGQTGSAWRLEVQSAPTEDLRLRAFARQTGSEFDNPSLSLFEIGSARQGVDASYRMGPKESALFEYYRQSGGGYSLMTTNTRYRRDFSRARTELEIVHQRYGGDLAFGAGDSTLLSGRVLYPLVTGLDLFLQREQALSGENPLRPSGTTLGFDYQVMPKLKLLGRQKLTDEGKSIASFGVSSEFLKGTSFTSTYELNSVANGGYNQASVALNNTLSLAKFVTSNLAVERVQVFGSAPSYTSVSGGLEYKPNFPFTGSLKVERRASAGDTQTSVGLGAVGRIGRDLSVVVRHTAFDGGITIPASQTWGGTLSTGTGLPPGSGGWGGSLPVERTAIGLAYRPANDRWNVFARYQIRDDAAAWANTEGSPLPLAGMGDRIALGSIEAVFQPRPIETFTLKHAFRSARASTDGVSSGTLTTLWLGRYTAEAGPRWNLSAEFRWLNQRDTHSHELGYGIELGYLPGRDMIASFGYNFAGQDSLDLSGGRRWAQGPYVRLGTKFDEGFFGGER